jgi:zinc transporter, ZIP family
VIGGIFTFIPALALVIGGAMGTFYQPSRRIISSTQHLAAGVVFAAVAKELLPKLGADNHPLALVIGFSLGVLLMLYLKKLTKALESKGKPGADISLGLVGAVGIDVFIDGVLIGIAFLAGTQGGILIAVALAIEVLFLGLSTTATLGKRGVGLTTKLAIAGALALLIPLGSTLGALILSHLSNIYLDAFLAFGVAALLYLVTEELLIEAHESPTETPWVTSCFFWGFLLILLIDGLS